MSASQVTTDAETIKDWAERHGGSPAHVASTGKGDDPGILRIDFPGFSGEDSLEPISWEQFFEWFEKNQLALIYRDEDRFNKIVSRKNVDTKSSERSGKSGSKNSQKH